MATQITSGLDVLDVWKLLKAECDRAGGQKAWAAAHEVSLSLVNGVVAGGREPSAKLLKALRLRPVTRYVFDARSN